MTTYEVGDKVFVKDHPRIPRGAYEVREVLRSVCLLGLVGVEERVCISLKCDCSETVTLAFEVGDLVRISGFSDDSLRNGEYRINRVVGNHIFLNNNDEHCTCESCLQIIGVERIGGQNVVVNDEPVCVCERLSVGHDPDCEWMASR